MVEKRIITSGTRAIFNLRTNEYLLLDFVSGSGKLLFDAHRIPSGNNRVSSAIVYDSSAYFQQRDSDPIALRIEFPSSHRFLILDMAWVSMGVHYKMGC